MDARIDSCGRRLMALLALAALAMATGCEGEAAEAPQRDKNGAAPQNVIFIVIDALRADHLGTLGYERETTPNLDALANRSLLFTRAYSAAPWTLPSLASYMTSVYPTVHGLRRPPTEADQFTLPDQFLTLAESLGDHGFRTASITSQPWISEQTGLTQGFDEARAVSHASAPGEARVLAAELIDWLRVHRQSRFFLYAHFMGPHSPYDVPSEFSGRFTAGRPVPETVAEFHRLYEFEREVDAYRLIVERAKENGLTDADIEYLRDEYDEKLAFTDACLGLLFRELESQGLFDNSLVIVTADHGEAFYEHGTVFHGQHLYEELVRVPLILHLPGAEITPARVDQVVELIDLYPTVHEQLGIPVPPYIEGESLIPVIRGGRSDGVAFSEYYGFKLVTRDWSSFYEYGNPLHLSSGLRIEELYHLAADPQEQVNLAGTEPEAAARHRELAFRIWQEMLGIRDGRVFENETAELDAETIQRLRSLGYLGGGS